MYSNIQESTSNLFYGMFTFALKKMLQIFIWKNSILRFMETLKYLIIYQFWSNYFATLRWNNSNFTLEWNLEAEWSRKECGGGGKGLWHKEAICAILKL